MNKFYTILTTQGQQAFTNAVEANSNVLLTKMTVGDGGGNEVTPVENVTSLANEVYTASLNRLYFDDSNNNYLVAELIIPATTGGFTIREIGLLDSNEQLLAYGNFPETYKPLISEGSSKDLTIRCFIEVANVENVELIVDTNLITATQDFVTEQINNHHHDELYAAINHTHDDMATGGINENILINGEGLINTYDTNKQFIHQSSRYYIDRHFWELTDEGSITWNPTTGARTIDDGGGYPWKLEQKFDAADLIKHRIYGAKATAKMACNFDHTINIVLIDNSNTETIINGTLNSDNSVTFDIPDFNSNLKTFIVRFSAETNGIITNFKLEEGDKFTGYPITSVPLEALKCNKYREIGMFISTPGGTNYAVRPTFKMPKRCAPNITVTSLSGSNNRISSWNTLPDNLTTATTIIPTISSIDSTGFILSNKNSDANYTIAFYWIADAEI
ncbi:phage tail protein [Lentisphaerota bacterium WC36G]|nr:phage tail protein [Lentisphaerae bacterium WC36]